MTNRGTIPAAASESVVSTLELLRAEFAVRAEMQAILQAISTLDEVHTTSLPWDMILKIRAVIAKATGSRTDDALDTAQRE